MVQIGDYYWSGAKSHPNQGNHTLHLCHPGKLQTFKLHCCVYDGKHSKGLNHANHNTANTQKWVNLYDEMLEEFKRLGRCMPIDSSYMGDIMGQIEREIWLMNFVGTCQSDQTRAEVAEAKKGTTIGNYKSIMFQHKTKCLSYAMWAHNNIVKTLSNFHSPKVLSAPEGMLYIPRVNGLREQHKTEVSCPEQQKYYSETFYQIDKGNVKESKYNMGGQKKGHTWAPKLHMRFWNFNLGNSCTAYDYLVDRHIQDHRKIGMTECVQIFLTL